MVGGREGGGGGDKEVEGGRKRLSEAATEHE